MGKTVRLMFEFLGEYIVFAENCNSSNKKLIFEYCTSGAKRVQTYFIREF